MHRLPQRPSHVHVQVRVPRREHAAALGASRQRVDPAGGCGLRGGWRAPGGAGGPRICAARQGAAGGRTGPPAVRRAAPCWPPVPAGMSYMGGPSPKSGQPAGSLRAARGSDIAGLQGPSSERRGICVRSRVRRFADGGTLAAALRRQAADPAGPWKAAAAQAAGCRNFGPDGTTAPAGPQGRGPLRRPCPAAYAGRAAGRSRCTRAARGSCPRLAHACAVGPPSGFDRNRP